jgi:hypothetical protein
MDFVVRLCGGIPAEAKETLISVILSKAFYSWYQRRRDCNGTSSIGKNGNLCPPQNGET